MSQEARRANGASEDAYREGASTTMRSAESANTKSSWVQRHLEKTACASVPLAVQWRFKAGGGRLFAACDMDDLSNGSADCDHGRR